MINRFNILVITLFGYGIGIGLRKAEKNHNPKSKNYDSDGSIKKFKTIIQFNEFNDWSTTQRFFYNYSLTLRLFMKRG